MNYSIKFHNLVCVFFACIFMVTLSTVSHAFDSGDFCDYIPRYRKLKSHYQIDKILYKGQRTIVHFRFLAQGKESIHFYSGAHPSSWFLRTPARARGVQTEFKQIEISDLKINGLLTKDVLDAKIPNISYNVERGDVVTFALHFRRIPIHIRKVDLIEGQNGHLDGDKHNCFDIMVKTARNPMLGKAENTKELVKRFERTFTYAKTAQTDPKKAVARRVSVSRSSEKKVAVAAPKKTPEPIDYTPKNLVDMSSLECEMRVILPNVNFKEESAKFDGRMKALGNIRFVKDYLKIYPSSKVNLYGHTDIYGNPVKNRNLARERAMVIKRELVRYGIDPSRITVLSMGGENPLPEYKQGGSANRRVEVEPICE
jgi:outer membrane protein OmpA-like peptidoglycan-associated protein